MDNKLKELEEKKKKLELKAEKYKRESKIKYFSEKKIERKERAYKLIKLGALFEICNLLETDHKNLLGYLSNYKNLSEAEKENFSIIGNDILLERKKKKNFTKRQQTNEFNKMIDTEQILELIKLAKEKNIDVIMEMQKQFNKKLLERLTVKEYNVLKTFLLQ